MSVKPYSDHLNPRFTSIILLLIHTVLLAYCALKTTVPLVYVMCTCLLLSVAAFVFIVQILKQHEEKVLWFEQLLDAVPMPLSVTDLDMKWTFVNKAATEPLGVTRDSVLGMASNNWGRIFVKHLIVAWNVCEIIKLKPAFTNGIKILR